MSRTLSVTEPHPTVPKSGAYLMGGRGGAGNYKHYTSSSVTAGPNASGPASRVTLTRPSSTSTRVVAAGRGGVGNMYAEAQERVFQFDEEMLKRREAPAAPVYHIGRGGGGNFVDEAKVGQKVQRSGSDSSVSSSESVASVRRSLEGAVRRLTKRISGQ